MHLKCDVKLSESCEATGGTGSWGLASMDALASLPALLPTRPLVTLSCVIMAVLSEAMIKAVCYSGTKDQQQCLLTGGSPCVPCASSANSLRR